MNKRILFFLSVIILMFSIVVFVLFDSKPVDSKETKCFDSDGGINYNVKGKCKVNERVNYLADPVDHCLQYVQSKKLVEFYCSNNDICAPKIYDCPGGCVNGKCKDRRLIVE